MQTTKSNKNLFIVIFILIAVFVAGYMYIKRDQSTPDLLISTQGGIENAPVDGDLLSALRELKKIKFDDSLFKNAVWLSLVDFGKNIDPQEKYRPNPFAPLDSVSESTTTPTVNR